MARKSRTVTQEAPPMQVYQATDVASPIVHVQEQAPQKAEYETAVDVFWDAESAFRQYEEWFKSGQYIIEAMSHSTDPTYLAQQHQAVWSRLQELLEQRNVSLLEAKSKMREAVTLTTTQWRGPRGKSTKVEYRNFKVESRTGRTFVPQELFRGIQARNLMPRMLALSAFDKENKQYSLVAQQWKIDFPNLLKWLEEQKLDDVINGAYEEAEGTPAVTGPKEVVFLGEVKSSAPAPT